MSPRDPISEFGTSERVATFLLHESFRYAHEAAAYEVASLLFEERLQAIVPDPSWQIPDIPKTLGEWLERREEIEQTVLDPNTIQRLSEAWQAALRDAWTSDKKLMGDRVLSSITDIIGFVINLTICLELIMNRHLYLLRESRELSPSHFKSMDRTEIMPKILFCFKEEILSNRLEVSRIKQLVGLRNKAVHYRVDDHMSIKLSVRDLFEIWREIGTILDLTRGEPTQTEIQDMSDAFVRRWIGD